MRPKLSVLMTSFILASVLVHACAVRVNMPTETTRAHPNPQPTPYSEIASPSPLSIVQPTSASRDQAAISKVHEGMVHDFSWSSDSSTLFFWTSDGSWAYDMSSGTVAEQNAPMREAELATPEIPDSVPPNAKELAISPAGSKLLYITLSRPSPTAPPDLDGEYWFGGTRAELWLWKDGDATLLGEITDCVSRYHWGPDESLALIEMIEFPQCRDPQAWLVGVDHGTLTPLFPKEEYPSVYTVRFTGFSPDGDYALFVYRNQPLLLELDSRSVSSLDTPRVNSAIWIDSSTILLGDISEPGFRRDLAFFYLDSQLLVDITGVDFPPAANSTGIYGEEVSPDSKWIAFVVGETPYDILSLWIMEFAY